MRTACSASAVVSRSRCGEYPKGSHVSAVSTRQHADGEREK
eukprot:COSAG06_NODE_21751_length_746_cov_2.553846_2_plen_40_part_01